MNRPVRTDSRYTHSLPFVNTNNYIKDLNEYCDELEARNKELLESNKILGYIIRFLSKG